MIRPEKKHVSRENMHLKFVTLLNTLMEKTVHFKWFNYIYNPINTNVIQIMDHNSMGGHITGSVCEGFWEVLHLE
jgi:hypothetical protein